MTHRPTDCSCRRFPQAYVPRRPRHGLHRPGARRHAPPRRHRAASTRRRRQRIVDAARRQAALRAEGQERHLAVHDRRRQPHGELRPQARAQQVRRQDDRRDAVQGRARLAVPEEEPRVEVVNDSQRSQPQSSTRCRSATASAARAASRSATGGRTSATASTTSPSSARCGRPTTTTAPSCSSTPAGTCSTGRSRRSAPGCTTAWARSTRTCRSSSCSAAHRRLLRRHGRPRRQLPRPRARRRAARSVDPTNPLPFATPGDGRLPRGAGGRVRPARPAQPAAPASSTPTTRPCGPHQVVRAGLPHADGRARGAAASSDENRGDAGSSTASTRTTTRTFGQLVPGRAAAGRARRALRPGLPRRQRRRRRLGRPRRPQERPHHGTLRPGRQADRRPAQGPEAARPARRDAGRLGHRVRPHAGLRRAPTAATTTPTASPSGWPAAASRAASSTAPPTRSASTPSRTATTSPTSTPRCCTSSASTRAGWRSPAASGWRSTTASRSARSSPDAVAGAFNLTPVTDR